jgi:hypothetical protein
MARHTSKNSSELANVLKDVRPSSREAFTEPFPEEMVILLGRQVTEDAVDSVFVLQKVIGSIDRAIWSGNPGTGFTGFLFLVGKEDFGSLLFILV